ncbi:MAG: PrgI family protein [Clostridiales bacterium]|nr:PrgI family protein [Clostridiales bacterium]
MNIPINKDLEEEYKSEWMKGFDYREIGFVVISIIIIAGVAVLAWWKFGVPIDICIYIGLPFGFPFLILGFKKIQGLTVDAYLKEMLYEWRTRELVYDADEIPEENRVFTMERKKKRRGGRIGEKEK